MVYFGVLNPDVGLCIYFVSKYFCLWLFFSLDSERTYYLTQMFCKLPYAMVKSCLFDDIHEIYFH